MPTVAVVGAGVAGLAAAYRLKRLGRRVVVYEAEDRPGGVVRTERRDGYLADLGPNSIASPSPALTVLFDELGLAASRIAASPAAAKRYVVRRGRLVQLPTSPQQLLTSRLLSNTAKLAVFGEPLVDPADSALEESVAAFVRRRFNQEVVDYVANPFVAGVFAGDPEQLSIRHAFPQLHTLETTHGSLLRALMHRARARRAEGEPAAVEATLVSFRDGMEELPAALGRALRDEMRYRSPVVRVRRSGQQYEVTAAATPPATYDALIYAAPAHRVDEIGLEVPGGERLPALASVLYPPVAVLVLGFRREDVAHPLDGFGLLAPEIERRYVLGVLFSSTIFPGRAPEGHVTLTCFTGGARDPQFAEYDEQTLTARVLDDLRALLGVKGDPTFRTYRLWPKAIPQYVLGYGRYKELMDEVERRNPGLYFAGNYRDGISLGEAIGSGDHAATRAHELLPGTG